MCGPASHFSFRMPARPIDESSNRPPQGEKQPPTPSFLSSVGGGKEGFETAAYRPSDAPTNAAGAQWQSQRWRRSARLRGVSLSRIRSPRSSATEPAAERYPTRQKLTSRTHVPHRGLGAVDERNGTEARAGRERLRTALRERSARQAGRAESAGDVVRAREQTELGPRPHDRAVSTHAPLCFKARPR